jgi:glycosyltransferase involved in cell wall biosynthesis
MGSPEKEGSRVRRAAIAIIGPVPPPYGGMALQGRALQDNLLKEGISAAIIPTNPPLLFGLAKIRVIRTFLQTIAYLCRLIRIVPQVSVVHVLAASYFYFFARVVPAVLISRFFGRRVIVNYRGGEAFLFFSKYGWMTRSVLHLCSLITVPSAYLEKCFREQGFACAIVGNLIDLDRFKFRQRRQLRPHLLVTRNLEPMYNVQMALQAFEIVKQEHRNARIDIVGTGSEESKLRTWVEEKGLDGVFFHGAVRNDKMPQYLEQADILLNPTNVDNLPMTLIEAFASGLPVVSTNVGGVPDLVGDPPVALLVEAGDYKEMAEKILCLLTSPDLTQSLIISARRISEDFSWDRIREKLLEVYFPKPATVSMVRAVEEREA